MTTPSLIDPAAVTSARRAALQAGRSWLGVLEDTLGIEPPAFVAALAEAVHFVFADPLHKDHSRWAQANLPAGYLPRLAHRDDIAAYLARQEETLRAIDPSLAGSEDEAADISSAQ